LRNLSGLIKIEYEIKVEFKIDNKRKIIIKNEKFKLKIKDFW